MIHRFENILVSKYFKEWDLEIKTETVVKLEFSTIFLTILFFSTPFPIKALHTIDLSKVIDEFVTYQEKEDLSKLKRSSK